MYPIYKLFIPLILLYIEFYYLILHLDLKFVSLKMFNQAKVIYIILVINLDLIIFNY